MILLILVYIFFFILSLWLLNALAQSRESRIMNAQVLNLAESGNVAQVADEPDTVVLMQRPAFFISIIKKVWPALETYLEKLLVDDLLKSATERIEGFAFEKLDFGNVPPTLSNLKLYNGANIQADEIVIDTDIVYAGGLVVSAAWKKIRFGIRNVRFSGSLRIRLAPLRPKPPFFGCLSVAMLAVPKVDFEATGFANFVDFKPIYNTLQSIIADKLLSAVVVPNAIVIPLGGTKPSDTDKEEEEVEDFAVTEFRCRVPRGVLQVLAVEANELASHDTFSKSDPFVRARLGADEKRTRTIQDSNEPRWCEPLEFDVRESAGALLSVDLFDEDSNSAADFIGGCITLDFRDTIARVADGAVLSDLLIIGAGYESKAKSTSAEATRYDTKWYSLKDTKDGRGRVRLGFRYFDFVEKPEVSI